MSNGNFAVSRRKFLKLGVGVAGAASTGVLASSLTQQHPTRTQNGDPMAGMDMDSTSMPMPGINGEVDHQANGFDPTAILTDFDGGKVSTLPNGQTLHEYRF